MSVGIRLEIAAGPGTLGEVQNALDILWSLNDEVPARVRFEVGIAAAEIAANILEHCGAVAVRMELCACAHEVQVEFIDSGGPVNIDLDCVCMPDELADRGRGLAMAKSALRLLSYCHDDAGNHWNLVSKTFAGNATPAGSPVPA